MLHDTRQTDRQGPRRQERLRGQVPGGQGASIRPKSDYIRRYAPADSSLGAILYPTRIEVVAYDSQGKV